MHGLRGDGELGRDHGVAGRLLELGELAHREHVLGRAGEQAPEVGQAEAQAVALISKQLEAGQAPPLILHAPAAWHPCADVHHRPRRVDHRVVRSEVERDPAVVAVDQPVVDGAREAARAVGPDREAVEHLPRGDPAQGPEVERLGRWAAVVGHGHEDPAAVGFGFGPEVAERLEQARSPIGVVALDPGHDRGLVHPLGEVAEREALAGQVAGRLEDLPAGAPVVGEETLNVAGA